MKAEGVQLREILLQRGLVTETELQEALRRQEGTGRRLGEVLIEMGALTQDQFYWALGEQLGLPYAELSEEMVDFEAARALPEEILRRYQALPILKVGDELTVALADPANRQAVADIEALAGARVTVAIASASSIARLLDRAFPPERSGRVRYCEIAPPGGEPPDVLTRDVTGVALVYSILLGAVRAGASEIHIEPQETEVRVRYRLPQGLREHARFPGHLAGAIATRLRILAGSRPDGRWQRSRLQTRLEEQEFELEILFLPTRQGEAVTVWLHRRVPVPSTVTELGLPARARKTLDRLLRSGSGLFLVTSADPASRAAGLYALARAAAGTGKRVIAVERVAAFEVADIVQVEAAEEDLERVAVEVLARPPDVALIEDLGAASVCLAAARAAEQGSLVVGGLPFASPSTAWHHLLALQDARPLLAASLRALLAARRDGERWAADLFPLSDRTRRQLLHGSVPWTLPTS